MTPKTAAENAGWDRELLALELQCFSEIDVDLDLTITSPEMGEVDGLIESLGDQPQGEADQVRKVDPSVPAVSRPGDPWLLGRHRLLCGDATEAASLDRLLAGKRAQMVFVDPPYNVPIDRNVCDLGPVRHQESPWPRAKCPRASSPGFSRASSDSSKRTARTAHHPLHVYGLAPHAEVLNAAREVYTELKNLCVWNKTNAG